MTVIKNKHIVLLVILIFLNIRHTYAGPPFNTDDPEPVNFRHWEYYISSISTHQSGEWSGTAPHLEFNYGLIQNVQIHLLLPLNYSYSMHQGAHFGYADTEFGIKYRFVQESDKSPQIGIFPILEIPSIKNSEFSDGRMKIYLPVWIQKSWNKITTYGGAGYWINNGPDNKNWIFSGWEIQYDFSKVFTLGGELFYHSADTKNTSYVAGFNIGGFINPTEKFHFLFSAGSTFTKGNAFSSYLGILWTI